MVKTGVFRYGKNTFLPSNLGRNLKMVQNHHPNLELPFSNLINIIINILFMLFIYMCIFSN